MHFQSAVNKEYLRWRYLAAKGFCSNHTQRFQSIEVSPHLSAAIALEARVVKCRQLFRLGLRAGSTPHQP
jgi:hypothetical protein